MNKTRASFFNSKFLSRTPSSADRGECPVECLCAWAYVCVSVFMCVHVFMWTFSKENEAQGTEVSGGTVAPTPWWFLRQPAIPSLPWPKQPTPESAPQVSQHATHTHPSFQAALNEFIQNDLQCMAHLFSTACDRLSSWNFLDTLKGH